jgi:hypothetical protein
MKLRNLTFIALALLGTASPVGAQIAQTTEPPVATGVEEIYVARSVREARITASTEFCAKARTGIDDPVLEDQYMLRSVATRTSDGRMLDTSAKTIGTVRFCQGSTADPAVFQSYGDFVLERVAFKARGDCHRAKSDFPEQGTSAWWCVLDLSGLPGEYVGGQLTTNTFVSLKTLGTETEPAGYTQSSIATIRLWRKRAAR